MPEQNVKLAGDEFELSATGSRSALGDGTSDPAGAAGMALALCCTILLAGCGSSRHGTPPANGPSPQSARISVAPAGRTAAEVSSLLAGIPQHGSTLGDERAPVAVQYFGDLQCPYCRRFMLDALTPLIERYVRPGRLKIQYRSLKTATRHPGTFEVQQLAALAAGRQNKLWNFIELFYREEGRENSGYVAESYLQGLAQQVAGLDLVAWTAARSDVRLARTLNGDARAAGLAGINETPSFLLGQAGNLPYASTIKKLLLDEPAAGRSRVP